VPKKAVLGKNSSPEKSSPENIARFLPQKSVLLRVLDSETRWLGHFGGFDIPEFCCSKGEEF